jgi:hypothetical protein
VSGSAGGPFSLFLRRSNASIVTTREAKGGCGALTARASGDPEFPAPQVEVYGEKRPPWLLELAPEQQ